MNAAIANDAHKGIGLLFASGDIAIIALTVCLVFALIANTVQYFVGNARQEKDFKRYLDIINAMNAIEGAIDQIKTIFSTIVDLHKNKPGGAP